MLQRLPTIITTTARRTHLFTNSTKVEYWTSLQEDSTLVDWTLMQQLAYMMMRLQQVERLHQAQEQQLAP
jgi:hypothetical protein